VGAQESPTLSGETLIFQSLEGEPVSLLNDRVQRESISFAFEWIAVDVLPSLNAILLIGVFCVEGCEGFQSALASGFAVIIYGLPSAPSVFRHSSLGPLPSSFVVQIRRAVIPDSVCSNFRIHRGFPWV
jgi:hypothetical protein